MKSYELKEAEKKKIEDNLRENAQFTESAAESYLNYSDDDFNVLYDSMRYSVLGGGKRIRAFLINKFYSLYSNKKELIKPYIAAIEMIHAYSLIHDDLPCMDNDDERRGKPTNHIAYGEANALLAGDALLTHAFNIVAEDNTSPPERRIKILSETARAAGHLGMIGGQVMDISLENKDKPQNIVKMIKLSTLKTGNLIMLAARTGTILGGGSEEDIEYATSYAKNLGLAFQIIDDILDETGDTVLLGKKTGSDKKNNKYTFTNLLGVEEAYDYAYELTEEAVKCLVFFKDQGYDTEMLETLSKYLYMRKK